MLQIESYAVLFGKEIVERQLEELYESMGMNAANTPRPENALFSRKRRTFNLSEWIGMELIHAGRALVHHAHRHEAAAH